MKLYPHATPDGIIQLVEFAELEKLRAELTSWQALAEGLAKRLNLWHNAAGNRCNLQDAAALAAYESAKKGSLQMFTPCVSCEGPLVCSDLGNCYAKSVNLPDTLAEAVKRMEAVPVEELDMEWRQSPEGFEKGHEAIRARLISAAKGSQP